MRESEPRELRSTTLGTTGVVLAVAVPVLIFDVVYFVLAVGYETSGYRHEEAGARGRLGIRSPASPAPGDVPCRR